MKSTVRFAAFADTHYADRDHDQVRYYRNSLEKLQDILIRVQPYQPDFIICLGDLIDVGKNKGSAIAGLGRIKALLDQSDSPFYLALGNHDVSAMPREALLSRFHLNQRGYGSFDMKSRHFVVLDTNYAQDGLAYTSETMVWDRCYVDPAQLAWLEEDLCATAFPTTVFAHANLNPRQQGAALDPHVVINHAQVRRVLEASGKVRLVLQGHCHAGHYSAVKGIEYRTLKAVVDGERDNYAQVYLLANDSYRVIDLY